MANGRSRRGGRSRHRWRAWGAVAVALGDRAFYLLRAPLRRGRLFGAVLLPALAAVAACQGLAQPLYRAEARLLAHRWRAVPSTLRALPDDDPVRNAGEVIHRRERLLALVAAEGPPRTRALDRLRRALGLGDRAGSPAERAALLDQRLRVAAEEGIVSVSVDWPDPEQARVIADGALQGFVEARRDQEVAAVEKVITALRARAASAREQLERVIDEVGGEPLAPVVAAPALPQEPADSADEAARARSIIRIKERAVQEVDLARQQRLADLQSRLTQQRRRFSDEHPIILRLREEIGSLSGASSQQQGLRDELAQLRQDHKARFGQELAAADPGLVARASAPRGATPRAPPSGRALLEDERVRDARFVHQDLVQRVNAAQLELDAIRAAFAYRYEVIAPAQVGPGPVSPGPARVLAGGLLALLLALLAAAAPDLGARRLVERWQVERGLGVTVLGEVEEPGPAR
jgi:hypothetical protein